MYINKYLSTAVHEETRTLRTIERDAQTFGVTPFTADQLTYIEDYVLNGQMNELAELREQYEELDDECSAAMNEGDRLRDVMDEVRHLLKGINVHETDEQLVEENRSDLDEAIEMLKVYQ